MNETERSSENLLPPREHHWFRLEVWAAEKNFLLPCTSNLSIEAAFQVYVFYTRHHYNMQWCRRLINRT